MLMARLWAFVSAFVAIDLGRPMLERNHVWKCLTHSAHSSAEICSRSNTGASFAGVAPRFPVRICLAVQSSSCRYSPRSSDRQPLFEARRSVCCARTALRFGCSGIGAKHPARAPCSTAASKGLRSAAGIDSGTAITGVTATDEVDAAAVGVAFSAHCSFACFRSSIRS